MNVLTRLDRRVASAFYGQFPALRPAQEAIIDPVLSGQNVVLSAGTGSGKTEAVMAPLVSLYWVTAVQTDTLMILYIAPTKALVNDLEKRLYPRLEILGLRVGIRHGDRDDLTKRTQPHILITTPESLDVLLFRNERALHTVRAVILDEVHLLYNTQRGLQLALLLQRLRTRLAHSLQWVAMSATVGRLTDVRDSLFGSDEPAVFLSFPTQRQIDAHIVHPISEQELIGLIRKLSERRPTKLLIFANSRRECERLAHIVSSDDHIRHLVCAHYSSLSPAVRVETEAAFAAAQAAICIATSTLELGIDIGGIDAVLLWDVPSNIESFLQRIGRGNRRAQKTNVICLVPDDTRHVIGTTLRFLALLDAARQGDFPLRFVYHLFGAVGQQFLSIIASNGGSYTRIADLYSVVAHLCHLDRGTVEQILAQLAVQGYLQPHGFKNQYGADEKLYYLVDYHLIYGNFGASSHVIEVRHGAKILGMVPSVNLLRVKRGHYVRFTGAVWKVRRAALTGIDLDPIHMRKEALDFIYPGQRHTSDPFIADRIWQLLHTSDLSLHLLANPLKNCIQNCLDQVRQQSFANQIPYSRGSTGIRYLTFAGYMVNRAVALVIGQTICHADDFSLVVPSPMQWQTIPTDPSAYKHIFSRLFEGSGEQSLYQTLLPGELQLRECIQDWLCNETIPHILSRLATATPVAISENLADELGGLLRNDYHL